jgi:hypothetical protein
MWDATTGQKDVSDLVKSAAVNWVNDHAQSMGQISDRRQDHELDFPEFQPRDRRFLPSGRGLR